MSLEDHSTLNEQDDVIEEIPNISVRRVDAHDNSFIMFFSEFFECADHNECSEWIQPGCWLIQEKHRRISDKLATDVYTFSFSSWDTFDELSTD